MDLQFLQDASTSADVAGHLLACDGSFEPSLSSRLDIHAYARKLAERARRSEAWCDSELVGLVAGYVDTETRQFFVSSVSVLDHLRGQGVAERLMHMALETAAGIGCKTVVLEVAEAARGANRLYEKLGFSVSASHAPITPGYRALEKRI